MDDYRLDLHLVSDSTGETVSSIATAILPAFASVVIKTYLHPLVRSIEQVTLLLDQIGRSGVRSAILCTMTEGSIYNHLLQNAKIYGIPILPVLDNILQFLESVTHSKHEDSSFSKYNLDKDYYRRLECINFAIHADDGQSIKSIMTADVVILGVSRTSKTPISLYIAQKGYKVANFPFTMNMKMQKLSFIKSKRQAFDLLIDAIDYCKILSDEERDSLYSKPPIFAGLTIQVEILQEIRQSRFKGALDKTKNDYSKYDYILKEIALVQDFLSLVGVQIFDVSNRAIEEVAAEIIEICQFARI